MTIAHLTKTQLWKKRPAKRKTVKPSKQLGKSELEFLNLVSQIIVEIILDDEKRSDGDQKDEANGDFFSD